MRGANQSLVAFSAAGAAGSAGGSSAASGAGAAGCGASPPASWALFECENLGDGKDPWPTEQIEAIVRVIAAICRQ
ncbi:N-acetylmuramoyl-L-alanine amidase, partial [Streptomyces sp. NPDC056159]